MNALRHFLDDALVTLTHSRSQENYMPNQTEPFQTEYVPTSTPPSRSPRTKIAVALTGLVIVGLTGAAGALYAKVNETEASLADTRYELSISVKDLRASEKALATSEEALTASEEALSDSEREVTALEAVAETCSVWPKVASHLLNSSDHLLQSVNASIFTRVDSLEDAAGELRKATRLINDAQSYDGELQEICGPNAGSNV